MTKERMIEFISGYHESINPRHYKGEEGKRILTAIYCKVKRRHDEKRAEEQRNRGLFS